MKKYRVVVLRSQYQTIVLDAENYEEAEEVACRLFDEDKIDYAFTETYDLEEV